ncbi:hypothetical protein HY745_00130 [Candidatus Desantisbacteria bacterium]|nr:hypothetical protein [Candidatus Desantisbacteria bacterium]
MTMTIQADDILAQELNLYENLLNLIEGKEIDKTLIYQRENIFRQLESLEKTRKKCINKASLSNEEKELIDKIKNIINKILLIDSVNYEKLYKTKILIEQNIKDIILMNIYTCTI